MLLRARRCRVPWPAVVAGLLSVACAVGGEVTDETLQAAALYDEGASADMNVAGMGPDEGNVLDLPTRGPNAPPPAPPPVPTDPGEPGTDAPTTMTPTVPTSPSLPTTPTPVSGAGGAGSRPVLMPPTTPSTGGTAPQPAPASTPAIMPPQVMQPEPTPQPEPAATAAPSQPAPMPAPTTDPTMAPQPEPTPQPVVEPVPPAGQCLTLPPNMSSGDLGTDEVCYTVDGPINGWQVSNIMGSGRTVSVNGMQVDPGGPLPAGEATYTFVFSAGDPAWVAWSYW